MQQSIASIREQYPQYSDMSDEELAGALHQRYYSDMPREDFNARVGLSAPQGPQAAPPVEQDAQSQAATGARPQAEGPMRIVSQMGQGMNEAGARLAGLPADITNRLPGYAVRGVDAITAGAMSRGLNAFGVEDPQNLQLAQRPMLGGEALVDAAGRAGFINPGDEPRNAGERISRRVGGEIVNSAPAALGVGMVARTANLAAPVAGRSLLAPAIEQAARTPAGYIAAEGASAVGSGIGAGIAREVAPGNPYAEAVGQMGGSVLATGLPALVRGAAVGNSTNAGAALDDFTRAGVDPSAGQLATAAQGRTSGASVIEGLLGKTPGSVSRWRRVLDGQTRALRDRISGIADDVTPARGDAASTGRTIQEGIRGFTTRFADRAEVLYRRVDDVIPPATAVDVSASRTVAEDALGIIPNMPATSRVMAPPRLRQIVNGYLADTQAGTIPYESLARFRSQIGQAIGDSQLAPDLPTAPLRRLYGSLSEEMGQAATEAGPDALRLWRRANQHYAAGNSRINDFLAPIERNNLPEEVMRLVERSSRGDSVTRLNVLRSSLTDDQWAEVSAQVLRRMGRANASQQGADATEFSAETFLTNWAKTSQGARNALFGGARFRGFRRDLDAIAATTESLRLSSRGLSNPSGTGQVVAASTAASGAAAAAATGNAPVLIGIMGGVGGANLASRLMTNRRFVRWLAAANTAPVERLPTYISRLVATTGRGDDDYDAAVAEYLSAMQSALPQGQTRNPPQ
jgi:hypothetical protein